MRSRLSYHDIPAAHIAYPYSRQASSLSCPAIRRVTDPGHSGSIATGVLQADGATPSLDGAASSVYGAASSFYGTGRVQAVRRELKPDLWKIAYKGVRRLVSESGAVSV